MLHVGLERLVAGELLGELSKFTRLRSVLNSSGDTKAQKFLVSVVHGVEFCPNVAPLERVFAGVDERGSEFVSRLRGLLRHERLASLAHGLAISAVAATGKHGLV